MTDTATAAPEAPYVDGREAAHKAAGKEVVWAEGTLEGEAYRFPHPKDAPRKIRFETPSGKVGEHENVYATEDEELDPETDDVIYDGAAGHYVRRVSSAESGSSAEASATG